MPANKKPIVLIKKQVTPKVNVATLLIDSPSRLNVLTSDAMYESEALIKHVAEDPDIHALVIVSGKPDNFCAGADLHEIRRLPDQKTATAKSHHGQSILRLLRALKKPTVAAVNGICLGGGVELILATHKRIATADATTSFGLPEVKLGLIPGFGGTQRLPRLVGLKAALELILSSDLINAERAKEIGLVDELVDKNDLLAEAERIAVELVNASPSELESLVQKTDGPVRDLEPAKQQSLFAMMERSIRIKTKGNYPAMSRVLDVMQAGLKLGIEEGLAQEAQVFGELAIGDVSHNLTSLFFATELAKATRTTQETISKVGVIGGGVMGSSIAHLAALSGYDVSIKEVDKVKLDQAMERLALLLRRSGQKSKISEAEIERAIARVSPVMDDQALADCDLIVEAVFENLAVKQKIFESLSKVVRPDCVLTSNTSSLLVSKIAIPVTNPERFLGMHFFHPVDKMPLVELIAHSATNSDSLDRAREFVTKLSKTPVQVHDGPGFLVNRLLCSYLGQAAELASTHAIPVNWIDDTAVAFGMPMGPFELLDEVGMDVAFTVARVVHDGCGDRMTPPQSLAAAEAAGLIGKKTGIGFYLWDPSGKRLGNAPQTTEKLGWSFSEGKPDEAVKQKVLDYLLLPMIDEAAWCLEEKIVTRPREVDMSMVLGIGFPPFRGGLLRYADSLGIATIIKKLEKIYQGTPRTPSMLLRKMLSEGRSFYSGASSASANGASVSQQAVKANV